MRRARLERLDRGLGAGVTDRGDNCALLFAAASGVQRIAAMAFRAATLAVCKALVPAWCCLVLRQRRLHEQLAGTANFVAEVAREATAPLRAQQ